MAVKAWYSGTIEKFLKESTGPVGSSTVFAQLNDNSKNFSVVPEQRDVWKEEIELLRKTFSGWDINGRIYFEYEFPRIGRRADVVILAAGCLLCLEFKGDEGGEIPKTYTSLDKDQALDYALDFADFNSESHKCPIVPLLVVTKAPARNDPIEVLEGGVHKIVCTNGDGLKGAVQKVLNEVKGGERIPEEKYDAWEDATYEPTPTIVQAAERLFENNKVEDITRSGADVSKSISEVEKIISWAEKNKKKVVCFVTGQPGAGKTLVGLKLATSSKVVAAEDGGDGTRLANRVFLSGNYPLVHVLQQALVRDFVQRVQECEDSLNADNGNHEMSKEQEALLSVCKLRDDVKTKGKRNPIKIHRIVEDTQEEQRRTRFSKKGLTEIFDSKIQLVSRFRAEYSSADVVAPNEHVFIFDEAQRAWDAKQIARKDKNKESCEFQIKRCMSEPEALLRYLSLPRKQEEDWCVAVALVGHGQDISHGEQGIEQWYKTLSMKEAGTGDFVFKGWDICCAKTGIVETDALKEMFEVHKGYVNNVPGVNYEMLHLKTTMRSYHAPKLSDFVDALIEGKGRLNEAKALLAELQAKNPATGNESFFLRITRDLEQAKKWLIAHGYGSMRRYGLLVSSKGVRLRRYGFHAIGNGFDEVAWFLDPKNTVNSSYAMEIAASEFKVQGLEIDFSAVGWDGDYWYDEKSGKFRCRNFFVSKNQWCELTDEDIEQDAGEDESTSDEPVSKDDRIRHLINAYRVILTRARQGMIIYVPTGEESEESNLWKGNYDSTYMYLRDEVGIPELECE